MLPSLQKMFKLFPGEGRKVLLFTLLGALLQAGIAVGVSTADALFLNHIGAAQLPRIYALLPLFMLLVTPAFAWISTRFGVARFFLLVLCTLSLAGIVFATILLRFPDWQHASTVFYAYKVHSLMFWMLTYPLFWNFIDGYFDILDAKRIYPLFSGGLSLGAIAGSSAIALMANALPVRGLILLWPLISLMAIPLLLFIGRHYRRIEESEEEESGGLLQQTRFVFSTMFHSRYVSLLFLILFTTLFLSTLVEYQYLKIFEGAFADEQQLARFLALLFGAVNLFNVVFNLFLFNRLVQWLGVPNTALAQPIAMLLVFSFFLLNQGMSAAVLGFFAYQGIQMAIDNNNWNFIFNAMPSGVKAQIRTVIEGMCEPLGTALAGLTLLAMGTPRMERLSGFGLSVSILLLVLVLVMRAEYVRAMITNLKQSWLDFTRSAHQVLARLEKSEIARLKNIVETGPIRDCLTAANLLRANHKQAALESLLLCLQSPAAQSDPRVIGVFRDILAEADHEGIRRIWRWIEQRGHQLSPSIMEELSAFGLMAQLHMSDAQGSRGEPMKTAAAVSSWHSWDPAQNLAALHSIKEDLSASGERLRGAISAMGKMGKENYVHYLAPFLADPDANIRTAALAAIRNLVSHESTRMVPALIATMESHPLQRRICLEALTRIADPECIVPLMNLANHLNAYERRLVSQLIDGIGLRCVPTLVTLLQDSRHHYQARALAARTLGRMAFPQFEALLPSLVQSEFHQAYSCLHLAWCLEQSPRAEAPGVQVLIRFYRDMKLVVLEFILECLTIGGRLPEFELISSSLRSANAKIRADAIETLEQTCERPVFQWLLPLVDSRSSEAKIRFFKRMVELPDRKPEEIAQASVEHPHVLARCAAIQACAEWELPGQEELYRRLLVQGVDPLVRETVLGLIGQTDSRVRMGLVDRMALLLTTPLFQSLDLHELFALAGVLLPMDFEKPQDLASPGEPHPFAYILVSGRLWRNRDLAHPAQLLGATGLLPDAIQPAALRAERCRLLRLARADFIHLCEIHPRLAIQLLEFSLAA